NKEDIFYYITVGNDTYQMPEMPKESREGILKGMYRFKKSAEQNENKVHLFGSGAIMTEVLKAAELLEKDYKLSVDVWSITSYKALYDNAIDVERTNRYHAKLKKDKKPNYIQQVLENEEGVFIAASDFVKVLPESIAKW